MPAGNSQVRTGGVMAALKEAQIGARSPAAKQRASAAAVRACNPVGPGPARGPAEEAPLHDLLCHPAIASVEAQVTALNEAAAELGCQPLRPQELARLADAQKVQSCGSQARFRGWPLQGQQVALQEGREPRLG